MSFRVPPPTLHIFSCRYRGVPRDHLVKIPGMCISAEDDFALTATMPMYFSSPPFEDSNYRLHAVSFIWLIQYHIPLPTESTKLLDVGFFNIWQLKQVDLTRWPHSFKSSTCMQSVIFYLRKNWSSLNKRMVARANRQAAFKRATPHSPTVILDVHFWPIKFLRKWRMKIQLQAVGHFFIFSNFLPNTSGLLPGCVGKLVSIHLSTKRPNTTLSSRLWSSVKHVSNQRSRHKGKK